MKKLFLTSAITLCTICPAMAEHQTVNSFPADEYMLEDYTYQNQANYTNMGVYSGSVNASADYTDINYSVAAGSYLTGLDNNNAATTSTCTAGNFCPGVQSTTYTNNAFGNTGLQSCSTATNGAYTLSATGATANTDCYRACTNSDVANSTGTMNGGYYYGDVNRCEPTACVSGWTRKAGLNLTTAIGTSAGENSAYVTGSGSFNESGSNGAAYYGLSTSNPNTWAVDYGANGMLVGEGRCSSVQGDNNSYAWTNPTILTTSEMGAVGGKYCYCNLTGYTPAGGTLQSLASSWVFAYGYGDASGCAVCARECADIVRSGSAGGLAFRAALLGSVPSTPAMCEANTITINWSDVDPEYAGDNNEDTATYGSDINTPVKAATKPGKTFRGWKFVKPANNSTPVEP